VRHLFITQDYPPDSGGMARRHVELCRRLAAESVVVSTVAAPGDDAFDRGEPYEIVRQPFGFSGARRFTNQIEWARWLARRVAGGVDLVHCGNIRPTGYAAWWAWRRARVPYLVYVNGRDLLIERRKSDRWLKRRTSRAILGRAAGIVANSWWTAELARRVMREVGVRRPPPVAAIDLGTDPRQFTPGRDASALRARLGLGDARLILSVARLTPHKGHDVAIDAFARIAPDFGDARYLIVGSGPARDSLRARAASLGVGDRVHFAGQLSDEDIAAAYATASVYLGLSRHEPALLDVEGFGISFVEAGAAGVPSVAGDSGGVRSAVRDGETGLVVPPTDASAVAAALRALLSNPERRAAMGRAARAAVETHYNWDRVARETLEFARSVTSRAPR
jgi:phosphatidylinositol alpha-1,6-mannosyltransferase